MSEFQQNVAQQTTVEVTTGKRRQHFTAGMIKWILNEAESSEWQSRLSQRCQSLSLEAKNLGNLPSESQRKGRAALKAAPAAVLYWLGIYTGFFWIIPGAAIGVIGSYFISESIYDIFKAGKDARFYRTFLHYLLRMENADGVISPEELASLRSIIEFIPAPAEEKQQWLEAIESPDGYQKLEPSRRLSDKEKEHILSGCWGLALCDGSADSEREIFAKFGEELAVASEKLVKIQQNMEAKLARHAFLVEETARITAILHPALLEQSGAAAEILQLVSLKPIAKEEWQRRIDMIPANNAGEISRPVDTESARPILLASMLLAKYLATPEQQICINETFQTVCLESGLKDELAPITEEISQALSAI
ncbi:MAG: hypothetical protein CVV42_06650 [Candidatus Riflebacteria bacterium HGW-Riflebacteria-2]|jgi:hypothetical protein|nr:MAG: hypothetical protein CVV42_06650 [Candidatus Riflebacteria bacterium HGW-Riflebacteria-2]